MSLFQKILFVSQALTDDVDALKQAVVLARSDNAELSALIVCPPPQFVADRRIGLLVMGTVARTGIPGFVIGNTAENIVRKLGCSLLAAKPQGLDSPVTA